MAQVEIKTYEGNKQVTETQEIKEMGLKQIKGVAKEINKFQKKCIAASAKKNYQYKSYLNKYVIFFSFSPHHSIHVINIRDDNSYNFIRYIWHTIICN